MKKASKVGGKKVPKYQGKEILSTIQAPTKKELGRLIRSTKKSSKKSGMEAIKVLERGKDPDGGYRAVVSAHNVNPWEWVKSKVGTEESKAMAGAKLERSERKAEEKHKKREEEGAKEKQEREAKAAVREAEHITELQREQKLAEASKERAVSARGAFVAIGAAKKAEFEAKHPTIVATGRAIGTIPGRLARGTGKIAGVAAPAFREMFKTRGAVSVRRKWGTGGELLEEEIEKEPKRGFYTPAGGGTRGGLYGDLSQLRSLTAPGALTGGMGLGHLRQLMLPGAISRESLPTVSDLTKTQQKVYDAIQGGANTVEAIVTATDVKKSTVTKVIGILQEKGLVRGG